MAPSNSSGKGRKSGQNRQAPKPAIPLPYVKRQSVAAAPIAATLSASAAPNADSNKPNGAPVITTKDDDVPPPAASQDAPKPQAGDNAETEDSPVGHTDGLVNDGLPSHDAAPVHPKSEEPDTIAVTPRVAATSTVAPGDEVPVISPELRNNVESLSGVLNDVHVAAPEQVSAQRPVAIDYHSGRDVKHRPPPAVSPSRYHMPPPFQPAGRHMGMAGNGDMSHLPRHHMHNAPPPFHQAHPSNGSVHFGALQGSASSSPAPPQSGGIAPPPGMPMHDGRQMYMQHTGNGFPPMMPYGAEMMPVSSFDSYGRPAMAYAPMDSYGNYGNNFPPSTPHSFPDSQSPGNTDDKTMYNHYTTGPPRNGASGPREDAQSQTSQNRMYNGFQEQPRIVQGPNMASEVPQKDDADGLVGYLQQQFGDTELADSTLELRYLDDRAPPVRIAGHRVIFSRSPVLHEQLRTQALQPTSVDRSLQIILLETSSKWVRSDSFYMATQRLYGSPLLPIPPPTAPNSGDLTQAGSFMDRFNFSLSYAAAGHLLKWLPLVRRGCDIAARLLDWQTMETALEFALEAYRDNGAHATHKYGEGSTILLNGVVDFIIRNLPPNFNLDTAVIEPAQYARLPSHTLPPPPQPMQAPAIARGSSVQLGNRGRRLSKFTNIQFGDLAVSDDSDAPESAPAIPEAQAVSHSVLSRVLLNLPFQQLKMVLESTGSGNVNGWANAEARYKVVKDAVKEREARRLRALDAVLAGRVPDSEVILSCLRSPNPQYIAGWTALGWQEEILPYGNADGPALGRKWVPLRAVQNGAVADYP